MDTGYCKPDEEKHKHYHDDDFDHKGFMDKFWCDEKYELIHESLQFPLKKLHEIFSSEYVKGNTVLDFTLGAGIYSLITAANVFKEIYVAEVTNNGIKEFERWLNKEPGVSDWSCATKFVAELEGKRDGWQEKEDKIRRAIKKVVKWDICGRRPVPKELPQVDCVISLWILNIISKTKAEFKINLKSLVSQLKTGGYLMFFAVINMTYYIFGGHKFFVLATDENFLREAAREAGLVIQKFELQLSSKCTTLVDYDKVAFLLARKEKDD
uniref:Provisional ortholog of nicotinamide N-methyltransferase n=1 Tax=Xenopus tropicalis TaxID=8364 RepID=A0A803JE49_XENTR|eukprot:XP_012822704.1 PREDICTED: nicotinamide N-methyltransferase-like [Xenopus tropicalis]